MPVCIYVCAHDIRSLWHAHTCHDVALVGLVLHSVAHLWVSCSRRTGTPAFVSSRCLQDHLYKSLGIDRFFRSGSSNYFEFGLSHHSMVLVNHHVRVETSLCDTWELKVLLQHCNFNVALPLLLQSPPGARWRSATLAKISRQSPLPFSINH